MTRGILALVAMLALTACDDRPRTWKAFVYPNVERMDRFVTIGGFKDFDSCQVAAIDTLYRAGASRSGDYVCGYRCGFSPEYGLEICKEKRK
jgi:hypothetical protein